MSIEEFLRGRLQETLPGIAAHREMIPDMPESTVRLKGPPPTARKSAVLIPLLDIAGGLPDVMFTLRSEKLRSHRGQISFPGGHLDDAETAEQAALRELHEETGVDVSSVRVLGTLSEIYIPPSNASVIPIVGIMAPSKNYSISEAEVREVFHVNLDHFTEQRNIRMGPRQMFGKTVDVPFWDVHENVPLWGATAMMLNELVWLVREFQRRSGADLR